MSMTTYAMSDRSTTFPLDDALITCFLEDEEPGCWSRFPRAESCVIGVAFGGFLLLTGGAMLTLNYMFESKPGYHSVLQRGLGIDSSILGMCFIAVAFGMMVLTLCGLALCKAMEIVELAHRYKEHKELCAYEDLRQSFRSQQSGKCDSSRYLGSGRISIKA